MHAAREQCRTHDLGSVTYAVWIAGVNRLHQQHGLIAALSKGPVLADVEVVEENRADNFGCNIFAWQIRNF